MAAVSAEPSLKKQDGSDASLTSSEAEESDSEAVETGCLGQSKGEDAHTHFTAPGANQRLLSHDHSPHVTDEVFNAASHLMGGMLSLLGTAALIAASGARGNPWAIVAFSLYGASLNFLFWGSFCHHAIRGSEALMKLLRTLDYVAIYFLIPGTMTPVCLVCLHDRWEGWVFFGTSWGLAILGVLLQTTCRGGLELPMWASMTIYITLGWFGVFLAIPAYEFVHFGGTACIATGGVVYTAGGAIFVSQRPNPIPGKFGFHEIWHIFVLAGAAIHFAFNWFYVFGTIK